MAGYIAARERLFQLSMVALAVKGELASVFRRFLSKNRYILKNVENSKSCGAIGKSYETKE